MGRKALPDELRRTERVVLKFTPAERELIDRWLSARSERTLTAIVSPMILDAARSELGEPQPED